MTQKRINGLKNRKFITYSCYKSWGGGGSRPKPKISEKITSGTEAEIENENGRNSHFRNYFRYRKWSIIFWPEIFKLPKSRDRKRALKVPDSFC